MDPISSGIGSLPQAGLLSKLKTPGGLENSAVNAFRKTLEEGVRQMEVPDHAKVNSLARGVGPMARMRGQDAFGSVLKDFVHAVDAKGKEAESMRTALLTGQSNNIHQTMIAVQESSVAFSLMVEVRNKVMDTYQELMRMQV